MWDLSYPTWEWTRIPCIGRWILNHWIAKEVPAIPPFCTAWNNTQKMEDIQSSGRLLTAGSTTSIHPMVSEHVRWMIYSSCPWVACKTFWVDTYGKHSFKCITFNLWWKTSMICNSYARLCVNGNWKGLERDWTSLIVRIRNRKTPKLTSYLCP